MNISNKILYVVSLNHAINDGSTSLIATLFPVFLLSLGFLPIQIGVLVAVGYLMNIIFQPIAGHYSDRVEPRNLLALGIFLIAISMIFFTISTGFLFILTSVIILRIGSSLFHPVGVSAISKHYSGSRLDVAMGFQSAFGNLGILSVFLVSAPLYVSLGLRYLFLVFAGIDLIVVLITVISMRNAPRSIETEAYGLNTQAENDVIKRYRFKLPIFFIITMLISGGSYAVIVNFGNSLLINYNSALSLLSANLILSGWIASAFAGAFVTGRLTKVIGRIKLLSVAYFACSLTTLIVAVLPNELALVVPSLIVNGFSLSVTYPTIYTELSAFLGSENKRKGPYFGVLFSRQIIGSVIMGFFSGYAWQAYGPKTPFEVLAILLFGAFVSSMFWTKIKARSATGNARKPAFNPTQL